MPSQLLQRSGVSEYEQVLSRLSSGEVASQAIGGPSCGTKVGGPSEADWQM